MSTDCVNAIKTKRLLMFEVTYFCNAINYLHNVLWHLYTFFFTQFDHSPLGSLVFKVIYRSSWPNPVIERRLLSTHLTLSLKFLNNKQCPFLLFFRYITLKLFKGLFYYLYWENTLEKLFIPSLLQKYPWKGILYCLYYEKNTFERSSIWSLLQNYLCETYIVFIAKITFEKLSIFSWLRKYLWRTSYTAFTSLIQLHIYSSENN